MVNQELFQSKHFTLTKVADGVYAAIIIRGTGAMGNAGIVDLGDRTLVFDTFYTPQAAVDLRRAAEQLFNRPVTLVVNSHGHADHVLGNHVFTDADIFATQQTVELIEERTTQHIQFAKDHPDYLDNFEKQIEAEPDETKQAHMRINLGDMRELEKALPTLEVRYPNVIFEDEIVLHGSKRSVSLITYGGGHTQSDSFLYLPEEKLAFMGDLLTVENHNQFFQGDIYEFVRILKQVEQLPIETAIPGHGEVSDMENIKAMRTYFEDLLECADQLSSEGMTPEEALSLSIPEKYATWHTPNLYARNVSSLLEQKLAKAAQQ